MHRNVIFCNKFEWFFSFFFLLKIICFLLYESLNNTWNRLFWTRLQLPSIDSKWQHIQQCTIGVVEFFFCFDSFCKTIPKTDYRWTLTAIVCDLLGDFLGTHWTIINNKKRALSTQRNPIFHSILLYAIVEQHKVAHFARSIEFIFWNSTLIYRKSKYLKRLNKSAHFVFHHPSWLPLLVLSKLITSHYFIRREITSRWNCTKAYFWWINRWIEAKLKLTKKRNLFTPFSDSIQFLQLKIACFRLFQSEANFCKSSCRHSMQFISLFVFHWQPTLPTKKNKMQNGTEWELN